MDEANRSLQRAPTKAQLHTMRIGVIALAQREALKAIKRQMQAKSSDIPHRAIVAAAADYLAQHRSALIADAKAVVERWRTEGMIGPRGAIRNPLCRKKPKWSGKFR
jgi:tagatose-1,6-bisphosphate aldolase